MNNSNLQNNEPRNFYPDVTVIMPVHNEADFIHNSLTAVLGQDYPGQMEILIADGMSSDRTREVIQEIAVEHPERKMQILDNPGRIVPTGMNIALRKASGEIIIRVDGHCIIARDYVSNCVRHLHGDSVDGVGGPMETIGDTRMAKAIAIGMSSTFGVGNSSFRTLSGRTMLADTVPFPAFTRQVIDLAGCYDEELVRNQDDEYNYRIRELGGKLLLADDVRSRYFSRSSLKRLWKQYFQYGYWKVRVLQKHPRQMSLRQFVPPTFVFALLISLLTALGTAWGKWALAFLVACYLVANLSASLITAAKKGWTHLPLLPLIFAILHLSYGSGFLVGLARFANRWKDRRGRVPDWPGEKIPA